jgi:1,4-alpha-glucan branching enzyme
MAHRCRTPPLHFAQHLCQIRPFHFAVVSFSVTEKVIELELRREFHVAEVDALRGTRFMFRMPEGQNVPDPASRIQPWGVDRSQEIVDTRKFRRTDPEFPVSSKS